MTDLLAAIVTPDVVGLLDRYVAVGLSEISRRGCLLESSSPIVTGTVAMLSVAIEGTTYSDFVRVARCSSVRGAGERHHVGVEFLPLERPAQQSLRLYAASLAVETAKFDSRLPLRMKTS